MNDIERAIEVIEDGDWWDFFYTDTPRGEAAYSELHKALDVALAALRAQLDRAASSGQGETTNYGGDVVRRLEENNEQ